MSPENEEELSPERPPISLKFEVPEFDRLEGYVVELEDGRRVLRSREELERPRPEGSLEETE